MSRGQGDSRRASRDNNAWATPVGVGYCVLAVRKERAFSPLPASLSERLGEDKGEGGSGVKCWDGG